MIKTYVHVLRPHYHALAQGDVCGAMILNYLEQWHKSTEWVQRTLEQISEDLFFAFSLHAIRKALIALVKSKVVLRRNNPKFKQTRTWQYQLNATLIDEFVSQYQESARSSVQIGRFNMQKVNFESAKSALSYNRYKTDSQKDVEQDIHTEQDVVAERNEPPLENRYGLTASAEKLMSVGVVKMVATRFGDIPLAEVNAAIEKSVYASNPTGYVVKAMVERWHRVDIKSGTDYSLETVADWDADSETEPDIQQEHEGFVRFLAQLKSLGYAELSTYLRDATVSDVKNGVYTIAVTSTVGQKTLTLKANWLLRLFVQQVPDAVAIEFVCDKASDNLISTKAEEDERTVFDGS